MLYIHQEPIIFAILPQTRKRQQLTAMEGNECRDKVSAYMGGGVATNLTKSNMWEQFENVFS
jgi:L-rhamnose mutarotase